MSTDPRTTLDMAPMSPAQWGTVAIMVGLNALDGFDVLSISFASPRIARAWSIDRAALGLVLSRAHGPRHRRHARGHQRRGRRGR